MTISKWKELITKCFVIPQRIILAIMGFLGIVNAYTMRVCLSVAITEMTVKHNRTSSGDSAVCAPDGNDLQTLFNSSSSRVSGEMNEDNLFDWSEQLQGTILSSFFWGYVITHIPGGLIADKFGGKWTLSLGILSTAIFTLFTPIAIIHGGSGALIALRALMGLGEGTTFPALSVLLSSWVPLKERSALGSFVFGGGQVGAVLGTALSGLLLHHFNTWEPVFYFWGAIGVIWFVIFTAICFNDPLSHPFIKESEKDYLQRELGQLERKQNLPPTPWISILTSLPMIALIFAQIGHDWGFYIMVTDLPKYMADVLQFPIKENGLYSSLPYLLMWIVSLISGFICDWMITRNIMGITNARKFWTILAAVGPAIFIVGASYAGCDRTNVVVLFTIAMGLMGTFYAGMKLNPLDLSPNYSGTIMAITNGIGAITGIIVPILVGYMTPNANLTEWRIVFWIAFAIFVITSIIYGIWASGEVQPWNNPIQMNNDKQSKQKGDLKT